MVAEKFEAIVKLGMANSRMKDFYDLWVLAQRFEFESATLVAAIQATFETRRTTLPATSPLALRSDFYDLPTKQAQWRAFLRKSGLRGDSSLKKIILIIEMFVMPAVEAILKNHVEAKVWSSGGPWKHVENSSYFFPHVHLVRTPVRKRKQQSASGPSRRSS